MDDNDDTLLDLDDNRPWVMPTHVWADGMDMIEWFDHWLLAVMMGVHQATPEDERRVFDHPGGWMGEDYGHEVLDQMTGHERLRAAQRGLTRDPESGVWTLAAAPPDPQG